MADRNRHTNGGRDHAKVRDAEDLARFAHHLGFLAGVAVRLEIADLRDDVVGDRLAEHLAHGQRIQIRVTERLLLAVQLLDLLDELRSALPSCTAHRLIRAHHQLAKAGGAVQRPHREHRSDRGAVRHRHDPGRGHERFGIDLGDRERHARLHPEGAGIVDARHAHLGRLGNKRSRDRGARRDERELHTAQGVERELPHRDVLASKPDRATRGLGGRERHEPVDREVALLEDARHLPPDRSGGSDDCYAHGATLRT